MYSDGYRVVHKIGPTTAGGATAEFDVVEHSRDVLGSVERVLGTLKFQHDTIPAVGVKGWTNECVLAVVRARLREFQAGPYECYENGIALDHVEKALAALELRTSNRVARGVEGTHSA